MTLVSKGAINSAEPWFWEFLNLRRAVSCFKQENIRTCYDKNQKNTRILSLLNHRWDITINVETQMNYQWFFAIYIMNHFQNFLQFLVKVKYDWLLFKIMRAASLDFCKAMTKVYLTFQLSRFHLYRYWFIDPPSILSCSLLETPWLLKMKKLHYLIKIRLIP